MEEDPGVYFQPINLYSFGHKGVTIGRERMKIKGNSVCTVFVLRG
jgi:hypothetical protein